MDVALAADPTVHVALLPAEPEFVDGTFVLRLVNPSVPILRAAHVEGIQIEGYPTGPRIGLADPADLDTVAPVWQVAGELSGPSSEDKGSVDKGPALAEALAKHLDKRLAAYVEASSSLQPPPEHIDVALIAASDAPCELEIERFEVTYGLAQSSFATPEGLLAEKQVLRFSGDRFETQDLALQLPAGAQVTSALLELLPSFGDEMGGAQAQGTGTDEELDQKAGVWIGVERWAAQRLVPTEALTAGGLALGLLPLSPGSQLLLELVEDYQGWPLGRRLATSEISLGPAGTRQWVSLVFSERVALGTRAHWLLAKTSQGQALWLAAAGNEPVRVLESSGDASWIEASVLDGLQAMYSLFSSASGAEAEGTGSSLTVRLGDTAVTASSEAPEVEKAQRTDTTCYALTSALNDHIAGAEEMAGTLTVPLTFTAGIPGIVTVYPPAITYDLDVA
jgi:hypothetical protein